MNLREIDKIVAQHVMELDDVRFDEPPLKSGYQALRFGDRDSGYLHVPHYSTDIAAAWQVVEKLLCCDVIYRGNNDVTSRVWQDGHCYIASAAIAPMSICLAALKAKGIEV